MNLLNMIRLSKSPLLLLCLFILMMAGSCQRTDKAFTLKGNLKNITGNEIYLYGIQTPFDRIDTIRVENGKFEYETELDTLVPLTLLFNRTERLPIFADKGVTVTVEGDALLPDSIRISGGETNEELNRFKEKLYALKDSALWLAEVDSFIRQHPFSQASIHLLNKYLVQVPQPDYAYINTLIENMGGILHDHPLIQLLSKKLENSIKSDTGRYISNFRIKNRKGENMTSHHFRDKVLVISFWATWNEKSLKLQEALKELNEKLKKKKEKIEFVYFSLDMDRKKWEDTILKDTLNGEQAFDGEGWESALVKQFNIENLPTVVVLNARRQIVTRSADIEELTESIEQQLKLEKEKTQDKKNKTKKK